MLLSFYYKISKIYTLLFRLFSREFLYIFSIFYFKDVDFLCYWFFFYIMDIYLFCFWSEEMLSFFLFFKWCGIRLIKRFFFLSSGTIGADSSCCRKEVVGNYCFFFGKIRLQWWWFKFTGLKKRNCHYIIN